MKERLWNEAEIALNYTQEKLHSVRPAKGMTYKQVETLPGRIRAISPATNLVRQKATDVVKRGK